jgi:hypothetical protein
VARSCIRVPGRVDLRRGGRGGDHHAQDDLFISVLVPHWRRHHAHGLAHRPESLGPGGRRAPLCASVVCPGLARAGPGLGRWPEPARGGPPP